MLMKNIRFDVLDIAELIVLDCLRRTFRKKVETIIFKDIKINIPINGSLMNAVNL